MEVDNGDLPVVDDFDELTRIVREHSSGPDEVYLRYSNGPATDGNGGPSRDYESNVEMPGLSVTSIVPEEWWTRPSEDWIARRVCPYASLGEQADRFPWLLTGRIIGRGPDHEPLVVDVRPVVRIGPRAVQQAKQRYDERFHVGQDSRS